MSENEIIKLEASDRESGKNPRMLRKAGLLPITIYGKDVNISAQVNMHEFKLAYEKNKNAQFEISYKSKKYTANAQNVQINYATCEIQNVEFAAV